jgi:isopenicillin N synthase-like dioxygenase
MEHTLLTIPLLDLADFTLGGTEKREFATSFGQSFSNLGLVAIKNRRLSHAFFSEISEETKQLFLNRNELSSRYEFANLFHDRENEIETYFKIGEIDNLYSSGQLNYSGDVRLNLINHELLEYPKPSLHAPKVFQDTTDILLRAMAIYLKFPEDYFEGKIKDGEDSLWTVHYAIMPNATLEPKNLTRFIADGEITVITILMGAISKGLQALRFDGQWISIKNILWNKHY